MAPQREANKRETKGTPTIYTSGQTEPLSANAVQSPTDMGYVVEASQADGYMPPAAMSRLPAVVEQATGVTVPLN